MCIRDRLLSYQRERRQRRNYEKPYSAETEAFYENAAEHYSEVERYESSGEKQKSVKTFAIMANGIIGKPDNSLSEIVCRKNACAHITACARK